MRYAYDGVKYNMDSRKNQRVRDRFVQREVIHNANYLVSFLQEKEHYDELEGLMSKEVWDYEVEYFIQQLIDEDKEALDDMHPDDQPDFYGKIDELVDRYNLACVDDDEWTADDIVNELKLDGVLEEFGWENNIEPEVHEPYEFWIVSEWFARQLKEQDEIVADDVLGFTIWGRCTTGQAISMDGVIGTICFNEGLLQGQKYYREG